MIRLNKSIAASFISIGILASYIVNQKIDWFNIKGVDSKSVHNNNLNTNITKNNIYENRHFSTNNLINAYSQYEENKYFKNKTTTNLYINNNFNDKFNINYKYYKNGVINSKSQMINIKQKEYINGNVNNNEKNNGISLSSFNNIYFTLGNNYSDKYKGYVINATSSMMLTEKQLILMYNNCISKSLNNKAYFYINIKNNYNTPIISLNIKYIDTATQKITSQPVADYFDAKQLSNYNEPHYDGNSVADMFEIFGFMFLTFVGIPTIGYIVRDLWMYCKGFESYFKNIMEFLGCDANRNIFTGNQFIREFSTPNSSIIINEHAGSTFYYSSDGMHFETRPTDSLIEILNHNPSRRDISDVKINNPARDSSPSDISFLTPPLKDNNSFDDQHFDKMDNMYDLY